MWLTVSSALAGAAFYSYAIEPKRFVQHARVVTLPAPELKPLRVLHLSDMHFYKGQVSRRIFIHKLAEHDYDLIFITGDLIDNDSGTNLCLTALRPLKAKYGIFAVLGNHDYYHISGRDLFRKTGSMPGLEERKHNDVDYLVQGLKDLGITVLQNQRVELDIEGNPLTIAGIDDPYVERDDIPKTLEGFNPDAPCLVLVHSPEKVAEIAAYNPHMVFMGHTHGGQIRLPLMGALITRTRAPRRFADGMVQFQNTLFCTSRGMGTGQLTPVRMFCPPEVTCFELRFDPNKHPQMPGVSLQEPAS